MSLEAPQQHKQPSRKGKRAWRKHVDVSDVQEGLESAREEIINGGIIAERASGDLFTLDTTGSDAIQNSYNKLHKPLKADQILAQRSAVPAIDSRKRSGITDGIVEPSSKRRRRNGVSHKEYERLRNRAYGGESVAKDIVESDGIPTRDPWEEGHSDEQDPRFSYLEKPKLIMAPRTLKEAPISLIKGAKAIPGVVKPKAGMSYNPVFRDWDQLLMEEGQKEVRAEQRRMVEAEAEQERLARIAAAQEERYDIQTEDESAWEGFESEYEGEEWLAKRRPDRKTPVERNKVKKRKEAERQAKWEAQMKKRAKQAQQINAIATQVAEQDAARLAKRVQLSKEEWSLEDVDDTRLRRKKLGKTAIPERSLELVLPDELQDSLRLLKPEGNLLKDRFRNLLVRGMVEARKPIQQPKKAKKTYTEKWTYKDFTVTA